tara:strand:+ start:1812 stop:2486 length:675 start_codon:yes stop_codon:yes gene_type:complete
MPIKFYGTGSTAILWHGNETIPGEKTFNETIKGNNGIMISGAKSYFTEISANNIVCTNNIVCSNNIICSNGTSYFTDISTNNIVGDISSNGTSYFTSIGVGLTNPNAALHVNGKILATDDIQSFYSSDRRFKDNIRIIENPLESLDRLNGYRFTWNDELSHIHSYKGEDIGVIAQEVEDVLPEIVSTRINGYKGVKYEKIIPLLIECIKELKSEIDILKSKIYN